MANAKYKLLASDAAVLRELAKRYLAACKSPRNQECRRLWFAHDRCRGERPLILTETDGGIEMVVGNYEPRCQEPWARDQERWFISKLAHFETIGDDYPLEPCFYLGWQINVSDYGVAFHHTDPTTDGTRGAYHIDALITDLEREFDRLRPRTFSVDREATQEMQAVMEHVYDGLLDVRIAGHPWWSLGMTWDAIRLIGLENLMVFMYDQPQGLHRLMAFLRDDVFRLVDWMEKEDLLVPNNRDDYVGSGSRGYTDDLPRKGSDGHVRTADMWVLLESQETVGVGPDLFAEFIFPYQEAIARRFGKVYYGCCEPLHTRWNVVKQMTNLKRVSVSPWCDEPFMAEALGGRYVYSRKPKPTLVSTERFDEDLIRQDLRTTMQATKKHGCTVEIVMKDVHTLGGHRDRLTRWTKLAREVTAEVYG